MTAQSPRPIPLKTVLVRWDELVQRWGFSSEERSALIGGFPTGSVTAVETYQILCGEQRMRLLVEMEGTLRRTLKTDANIRAWLRLENVSLGGRSPLEVMAQSPEWIRWLIDNTGQRA